jgi:hypothetical protein
MSEKPYQDFAEWSTKKMDSFFREFLYDNLPLARRAAAAELVDESMFQEYRRCDSRRWAFVHPSTAHPGKFRFTIFDQRAWVMHEDNFETSVDALFEMFRWGYVLHDPGALERLIGTEEWIQGMRFLEARTKANALRALGKYDEASEVERDWQ